jgi:hypothetical protein
MDAWQLGEKAETWVYQKFQNKNATILEFGCGKGTEARSSSHQITVIEHNIDYITNEANCILAKIMPNEFSEQYNEKGWYDAEVIELLRGRKFDLIIIDGPPGSIGRSGILAHPWIFELSPIILVDDTHRDPERNLAKIISKLQEPVETKILREESHWGDRESTIIIQR